MQCLSSSLKLWRETAFSVRPLTAVIGNESGDLDSVVGSMCLAFVLNKLLNFGFPPAVPVLNFDPRDLPLRTDVWKILQHYNISHEMFLTADKSCKELPTFLDLSDKDIKLVLFDHNRLITPHAKCEERVVGIIDHHRNENLYLSTTNSFRIIKEIGSASSIVASLFRDYGIELPFPSFLLAPIIVDCENFDLSRNRATPEDIEIFKWLKEQCEPNLNPKDFYLKLKSWRADIFSLSVKDNLKRDYKSITGKRFEIGFSSIPCSPVKFGSAYPCFRNDCIEFMKERKIEMLFLTFAGSNNGQHQRDLIVIGEEEELAPFFGLMEKNPIFRRVEQATVDKYISVSYSITDTTLSRKKLLPVVRSVL